MNLSNLVEFARQVGQADDVPGSRPPEAIDIPVEGDRRVPFLDFVNRAQIPPWIAQAGPAADGVILEEGVAPPPRSSGATGQSPDVVAFYLPYHMYPKGRWGIYVLESGVAAVAAVIDPGTWPPTQPTIDRAWNLLVDHERFHCLAECAVTRGETLVLDGLYRGYFHDRGITPYEEAMANAYAFRNLRKSKASKSALADITKLLKSGGHGYDAFEDFIDGRAFGRGEALLAGHALKHDRRPGPPAHPEGSYRYLFQTVRLSGIPIRPVLNQGGWLQPVRKFPSYGGVQADAHVEDHPPVHFHLRIPPNSPQFRLTWPGLEPTGNPFRTLSSRERKLLKAYLDQHGKGIRSRLKVAYGRDPGPPTI